MLGRRTQRKQQVDTEAVATKAATTTSSQVPSQRQRMERLLDTDPHFQVFSFDRLHWIEPFRCSLISVAFEARDTMLRWLLDNGPWEGRTLKSVRVLHCLRWYHWLRENITSEPRLRFFNPKTDQWLNPFNGSWEAQVLREGNSINRRVLQDMAQILVDCPQVQGINERPEAMMLTRDVLSARVAGDDAFQTGELPTYHSETIQRPAVGLQRSNSGIRIEEHRPFATQELVVISKELDNSQMVEAPSGRWQWVFNGMEMAPVSWSELQQLVSKGKITPETMVMPEGSQRYVYASQVRGLFTDAEERWSMLVDGLRTVPMSLPQLLNLRDQGRLRADATLVAEHSGAIIRADQCPGLFTTAPIARPVFSESRPRVAKPVAQRVPTTQVAARSATAQVKAGTGIPERWLVQIKANEQKLVTAQNLRAMARSGSLTPQMGVRREDMDHFVPASTIRGLF